MTDDTRYGPATPGNAAVVQEFLGQPTALQQPWVESPFFESQLESRKLGPQEREWARTYHEQGYLVLEDFFEPKLLDAIVAEYGRLFERPTRFDVPDHVQKLLTQDVNRIQDAWWVSKPVKRLAADDRILGLLELLYCRKAIPFQTLNFVKGTEQATHSDAIHFSSLPARYMCGVWVALEDITERNGPLNYYPGSHRVPELRLEEFGVWAPDNEVGVGPHYGRYEDYVRAVITSRRLEQKRLTCKKGTALIWASNLLHGGCPILQPGTTRLSQVTHYYFERCLYYTPILSNSVLGEYCLKDLLDLRTGKPLKHTINGEELDFYALPNGRHRVARKGSSRALGTLMPPAPVHAAPVHAAPATAPPAELAAPRPDAVTSAALSAHAADVRQTVLTLMEQQARIVHATEGDPIDKARVLAQLCQVALNAVDGKAAPTP
jgi:ectoine hydroxylase-related dioxygenase (phytanoyl-CoA dioxygenase family)